MSDEKANLVLSLQPVTFDKAEGPSFGFIAEDVEAIYPEAVVYNPVSGDVEGIKYDILVAPLIALVKTMRSEIDALRAAAPT
jgi:hypothetical protein